MLSLSSHVQLHNFSGQPCKANWHRREPLGLSRLRRRPFDRTGGPFPPSLSLWRLSSFVVHSPGSRDGGEMAQGRCSIVISWDRCPRTLSTVAARSCVLFTLSINLEVFIVSPSPTAFNVEQELLQGKTRHTPRKSWPGGPYDGGVKMSNDSPRRAQSQVASLRFIGGPCLLWPPPLKWRSRAASAMSQTCIQCAAYLLRSVF